MKVDVETVSAVQKKLEIEVPWDRVKEELELAYKGLSKRAKIKGFRAGKVPRKVLEKYYRAHVEGEVASRLVDETFRQAVEDEALFPIDNPVMDEEPKIVSEAPFKFVAVVDVKPELDVKNVDGLEVEKVIQEIKEDAVEAELKSLQEKAVVVEPVTDRDTVENGDLAVVDFFGYVDGETFKGGKGINYTVEVGAGQMIPGWEDQIIGLKVGDEKTFNLRFPKDEGPEEAQNKDVEWKVDLKEIKNRILPELDDDFAQDLGEFDSLNELKENIKENLRTREDAKGKRQLRESALEALVKANEVEVPLVMVNRQLDFLLQDVTNMLSQAKTQDPAMLEAVQKLREENRERAEQQVAGMLLLEAVARQETVEVDDQELEGRLSDIARENNMNVKQVRAQLTQEGRLEAVRYDMVQDKALDVILERAKITERVATESDSDDDHVHDENCDHDH